MPIYITNPNLILLTQKLQEEVEDLDQNVPVFPKHFQAVKRDFRSIELCKF